MNSNACVLPPAKKLDFQVGIMTICAEFLAERTIRQDGGRLTATASAAREAKRSVSAARGVGQPRAYQNAG